MKTICACAKAEPITSKPDDFCFIVTLYIAYLEYLISNHFKPHPFDVYPPLVSNALHFLPASIISPVPPHISPFEFESPVYAGENVQVTCHVPKGDRPLNIRWRFENRTAASSNFSSTVVGDRAIFLSIASVGPANAGNYTCVAENGAGTDSYTAPLAIIGTQCIYLYTYSALEMHISISLCN